MATEARTLVWIDSKQALIVRWDGVARFLRIESEVPAPRRSTDQGAHDPVRRQEHLRRFISQVERRLEPDDLVEIVGPGTVRERLASQIDERDRRLGRPPRVVTHSAGPLTEAQLVALVRAAAGDAPTPARGPAASSASGACR